MVPHRKRHPRSGSQWGAAKHRSHRSRVRPSRLYQHRHSRRPQCQPIFCPVLSSRGDFGTAARLVGPLRAHAHRQGVYLQAGLPRRQPTRGWSLYPIGSHANGRAYQDFIAKVTAVWMLSPFTKENGGTLLVPGSHRADNNRTGGLDLPFPTPAKYRPLARPAAWHCSTPALGTAAAPTTATRIEWGWLWRISPGG